MTPASGPVPAPDPPAPSLAVLTIRLIGRLRSHHVARLAEAGLTIPEANVLLHLEPGAPMPMGRLAELMGYDKSNLTTVMAKLEARGAVVRDEAADRRTRVMRLTSAGEDVRRRVDERLTADSPLLDGLAAEEQERLVELLRRLDRPGRRGDDGSVQPT